MLKPNAFSLARLPVFSAVFVTVLLSAAPSRAQPAPGVAEQVGPAAAQALPDPAPADQAPAADAGRVQHLRVEDGGSRIDEVRVGGQTRSITVQPKVTQMPSYEVRPARQGQQQGERVWKIGNF